MATSWTVAGSATSTRDPSVASERLLVAAEVMRELAQRTGMHGDHPSEHPAKRHARDAAKRYLWTDAFAVCNYLGLARDLGDPHYLELALRLVDQVHQTLAHHRADDARSGWLSGLSGTEAEAHPTRGGLRIGKALPERRPDEPFDQQLEWDRDGQYFHYLTKWMHALDQVAGATGQPLFNLWARELAQAAFDAFAYRDEPGEHASWHMVWKTSVDLSRPLVPSMGHHDPLDGYVTYALLRSVALPGAGGPDLDAAVEALASMIPRDLETSDPLGLGGLLTDAYRIDQLHRRGASLPPRLLERVLSAALEGLAHYLGEHELERPPQYRLAFRELGLALGLHAVALMDRSSGDANVETLALLERLRSFVPLGEGLAAFWLDPQHQQAATWTEHLDINQAMLAAALAPEGFLLLANEGHVERAAG